MRQIASAMPRPTPSPEFTAGLLGGMLVLVDVVALLVILPIPTVLLLAPILVPGDRIDLGIWLVDTSREAWLAAIPGVILVLATAAVAVRVGRAQRARVRGWTTRDAAPVPLAEPIPDNGIAELTDRETQVLELMSQGLTNGAIARRLFISEATVRKHVGRIFAKLDVDNETHDRRVRAVLAHVQQSSH